MPHNKKIIGSKWVFKVKKNSNGSISRYKVWLVAQGFHQKTYIDYSETYTPIVKPITIRVILNLVLAHNWKIRQLDINNAFFHGIIMEEVFMEQLVGFIIENKS